MAPVPASPVPDYEQTAGNTSTPYRRLLPARGLRYDDTAVLLSRNVKARYYRRWHAPCTVWRNNDVLDLSKLNKWEKGKGLSHVGEDAGSSVLSDSSLTSQQSGRAWPSTARCISSTIRAKRRSTARSI